MRTLSVISFGKSHVGHNLLIHVHIIRISTVPRLFRKINTSLIPQLQLQATSSCCMFASPITIAAQLSSDVYIGHKLTDTSVGGTRPVAQRHRALVVQRRSMEIQVARKRALELSCTANTKKNRGTWANRGTRCRYSRQNIQEKNERQKLKRECKFPHAVKGDLEPEKPLWMSTGQNVTALSIGSE